MSMFNSILSKLGFGDKEAPAPVAVAPEAVVATAADVSIVATEVATPESTAPTAISEVDVIARLTALADEHAEKLNWKTSIVDLLKLLGMDSSLAVRKELAVELACPNEKMGDSASMNLWLHQTVLQKLAENGGNIPAELLN